MFHGFLKQSTAGQTRTIGPFIDDTDFKTLENGLTIANTDIKLKKNGATSVNKNSGGGTSDVNGKYAVTWDATDTSTVGQLEFSVSVAGALVVSGVYQVVEEAVYDALFASSAPGYLQPTVAGRQLLVSTNNSAKGDYDLNVGTISSGDIDNGALDGKGDWLVDTSYPTNFSSLAITAGGVVTANVTFWQGVPVTYTNGPDVNVSSWDGNSAAVKRGASDGLPQTSPHGWQGTAIPAGNMIEDSAGARWTAKALEEAPTGGGGSGGLTPLATGTAQAGAAGTITLAAGESATDDLFNGNTVKIISGTGAGQARYIEDYTGATKVADIAPDWTTTPDATSVYEIIEGSTNTVSYAGLPGAVKNGAVSNLPQVDAEAIGDDPTAGLNLADFATDGYDPGTNQVEGVKLVDTLTTYTGNTPQTGDNFARLGAPAGASVSADIASVQSDTDDIQGRLPATLNAGRMRSDLEAIEGNTTRTAQFSQNVDNSFNGAATGTPTTTTMVSNINIDVDGQFNGRIIIFDDDTTTLGLRGQATDITASTAATNTLTFTALTNAPVSGDTFIII